MMGSDAHLRDLQGSFGKPLGLSIFSISPKALASKGPPSVVEGPPRDTADRHLHDDAPAARQDSSPPSTPSTFLYRIPSSLHATSTVKKIVMHLHEPTIPQNKPPAANPSPHRHETPSPRGPCRAATRPGSRERVRSPPPDWPAPKVKIPAARRAANHVAGRASPPRAGDVRLFLYAPGWGLCFYR